MNYNTRQKQLTSEQLNNLIQEYRDTNDEKIIHKIFFSDIAYYKIEANNKRGYACFNEAMAIIYQAVRHSVIKYNKDKGTFLSYCRLWIRHYFNEHKNSLELVRTKFDEVAYYTDEYPLLLEPVKEEKVDLGILNDLERDIIKLYYYKSYHPKKVCRELNIKLRVFFAVKREAINKIRRDLK